MIDPQSAAVVPCLRHPRRETALRCGKCGDPICPACLVQTPVGARCPPCAQLRRLPQFDLGLLLLGRSTGGGFVVSLVAWYLLSFVPFLRVFLAVVVGVAIGEVMTRLARRRTSAALEVAAVVAVVAGLLVVETALVGAWWSGGDQGWVLALLVPAAIASFVAVIKLR